jgi:SHS2 domain-containing protein
MKYEFLEHTADVFIAARGTSLEETFENAALATMEVLTDTRKVESTVSETFSINGSDLENLLYLWLEEIIIRVDAEGLLFSKFNIIEITDSEDGWTLSATISGEKFDPSKHDQRQHVKAVTYHMMDISYENEEHVLKFVLDV